MTEKERLRRIVDGIKYHYTLKTQKELANILGCGYTYLSDMLGGRVPITEEFSELLRKEFCVNPEYLTEGKEPMFLRIKGIEEIIGDNNTQISGNSNNVNNSSTLEKAINEISEMRKIIQEQVRNNQDQFERFMAVIEKLTNK